jgi:hypothetical protein
MRNSIAVRDSARNSFIAFECRDGEAHFTRTFQPSNSKNLISFSEANVPIERCHA